ncbi:MAG: 5'/3'-nucleotidase SurE [Bacteroidota bacterium]
MKEKNRTKKTGAIIGLLAFQIAPLAIVLFHLYSFSNYNKASGWLTDTEGVCKFYTTKNSAHRSFTWTGPCKAGLVHGQGKLSVYESDRKLYDFEGFLKEGKIDGYGVMRWAFDGDVYEGHFKKGALHGFGRYYNDDGDHYEGDFVNWERYGEGTYWYDPESEKFKYTGEWKNDEPHGIGTLYYRDGTTKRGVFESGELTKEHSTEHAMTDNYPKNVLITNDDGVEDMNRLICLAEAISERAEMVVVVASSSNRSGTSNMLSVSKTGALTAKLLSLDRERNIYIYEVDGYPADCVLFGGLGVFQQQNKTIDLVISGINGGANPGLAWFGSGTIGAARTAALASLPSIAISGINEDRDDKNGLEKLCKWVANFSGSKAVQDIQSYEYLTVSIPENLDDIKGVKVVERAISFDKPPFYLKCEVDETENLKIGKDITWYLHPEDPSTVYNMPAENDIFYYNQGYIVIVPMSINENNYARIDHYSTYESELWKLFLE